MSRPTKAARVRIDPRAAEAHGVEGLLPIGAIIVTAGVVLKVRPDGGLDAVGAGGHPHAGIAGDPTAARQVKLEAEIVAHSAGWYDQPGGVQPGHVCREGCAGLAADRERAAGHRDSGGEDIPF